MDSAQIYVNDDEKPAQMQNRGCQTCQSQAFKGKVLISISSKANFEVENRCRHKASINQARPQKSLYLALF